MCVKNKIKNTAELNNDIKHNLVLVLGSYNTQYYIIIL
ncbi:hypothetical protein [uncultured Gammaproteobacteria bacterium]|nr:hypothetical protein [uncultured Gammaproteobacteria bacterium]CAC9549524.1 hypothetical protein [uncultured Gammaproteobacteria bacterium]CAC9581290.1 hypothetical protein [uncultured Gammaproteobacteria bacterium]